MNFNDKIQFILRLPLEKKGWLGVFAIGSLLAWIALRFVPMRKLSKLMGSHLENRTVCIPTEKSQLFTALQMGQLMSMVANNTPWPCKCLAQALCVKWLLNRYQISSILYLGAQISNIAGRPMLAHAWINVHDSTVVGGPQHQKYQVVASFTTPKLI